MGLNECRIHLITQCDPSVFYNVTHGDMNMGLVIPRCGIRQGDPLSPYLFIICTEGLSSLIHKYESRKWIHGVRICGRAPIITHMLFANDCYLYCKASQNEATKLFELLDVYERATG